MCGIFEQTVGWIEDFMRQEKEPLSMDSQSVLYRQVSGDADLETPP